MHFHVQAAKEWRSVVPPELGLPVLSRKREVEKAKQWINCDLRAFDYSVLGQYVHLSYTMGVD